MEVTFSRAAADESLVVPRARAGEPLVPAGLGEPVKARPATVPAVMTAHAPSTTSTTRMGARGGLGPEPACLPFIPETDVLTTIPIVKAGSQRSQPTAGG